jgi:hypothetical protein
MTKLQYELVVENNSVQKEEGHFFYAAPFDVHIGDKSFHITFEKGSDSSVMRRIFLNNVVLAELKHPDYTPESSVDVLNKTLNFDEATTLFAAFAHVQVIFEKEYLKAYQEGQIKVSNYSLMQPLFL